MATSAMAIVERYLLAATARRRIELRLAVGGGASCTGGCSPGGERLMFSRAVCFAGAERSPALSAPACGSSRNTDRFRCKTTSMIFPLEKQCEQSEHRDVE